MSRYLLVAFGLMGIMSLPTTAKADPPSNITYRSHCNARTGECACEPIQTSESADNLSLPNLNKLDEDYTVDLPQAAQATDSVASNDLPKLPPAPEKSKADTNTTATTPAPANPKLATQQGTAPSANQNTTPAPTPSSTKTEKPATK